VLNAFRHHRDEHYLVLKVDRVNNLCSTPIGITAVITSASVVSSATRCCAQRLSGITAVNTGLG